MANPFTKELQFIYLVDDLVRLNTQGGPPSRYNELLNDIEKLYIQGLNFNNPRDVEILHDLFTMLRRVHRSGDRKVDEVNIAVIDLLRRILYVQPFNNSDGRP